MSEPTSGELGPECAAFPPVTRAAGAAILVVDLARGEVTYGNELARELAPDLELPVSVDAWSSAAGLADIGGRQLPTEGDREASANESLLRVAEGRPVLGEAVTAARATGVTAAREPLWVIGLPMTGAPEPASSLAVVAILPLRDAHLVADAQDSVTQLRDRAVLATRVSFTITDPYRPDHPLVWVNPAFTATTGYAAEEVIGRNCRLLQGPRTDPDAVAEIRAALEQQQPITTTLLNYRKDGTAFWNELSISPVHDQDGALTHFVGVQADVTARVQAQHARDDALHQAEVAAGRLGLLADFATRLSGSLQGDDIIDLLADTVVPRMATWCAIRQVGVIGAPRTLVRHQRPDDPQVAPVLERIEQLLDAELKPSGATGDIIAGTVPFLLSDDGHDVSSQTDAERLDLAHRLGLASYLIVPLRSRTRIVGSLTLAADSGRTPYTAADVSLAQELAARTALMLENSMLYAQERTAAVTLQRSLMPRLPELSGVTVAADYLTAADEAAVGGDWYDVFALRDGAVGIAVGDAMGHNFDSAAAMGKLSTMLRAYAWPGTSAAEVLSSVDALLAGTGQEYLATGVYGSLRLREGGAELRYASAGHPPAVVRAPDGAAHPLAGGRGPMLGISRLLRTRERTEAIEQLPSGSTLILFTDGLTDSMGDDLDVLTAVDRLVEIVSAQPVNASPHELVAALVMQSSGGRVDDVVVIAVRVD